MASVRRMLSAFGLVGLLTAATGTAAAPRVALLELYTSEGCNSCPPIDRWVSSLPPALVPERLVVLAFHVDYWNHLGWPDRFSQARFSARQQHLVRANGLRTAYTPQLLLNGRDLRDRGNLDARLRRINAESATVRLHLDVHPGSGTLNIGARADRLRPLPHPASLYVAVYENHLESEVTAGENRGRRLRHDGVVRVLLGPMPLAIAGETGWQQAVGIPRGWKIRDLGVAAFVQDDIDGDVLQVIAFPPP